MTLLYWFLGMVLWHVADFIASVGIMLAIALVIGIIAGIAALFNRS